MSCLQFGFFFKGMTMMPTWGRQYECCSKTKLVNLLQGTKISFKVYMFYYFKSFIMIT